MALQTTGLITLRDIADEARQPSSYSPTLSWVKSITRPANRLSTNEIDDVYGFAYFQRNNEGNCSNGNCTANCNCGNIQCSNCIITGPANCVNCDVQEWLQPNCNCACTYNCSSGETTYNCNCACACACACADCGG
jgi:hypothetical protein